MKVLLSMELNSFMLLLMQFGIIGVQIPAGVISDRWDRRWVLIACALMITAFAGLTSQVTGLNFLLLAAAFALWAGAPGARGRTWNETATVERREYHVVVDLPLALVRHPAFSRRRLQPAIDASADFAPPGRSQVSL